jgi:hypothetical protein
VHGLRADARGREVDEPDRLCRRAASRPRNARDGHRDIRIGVRQRAFGHGAGYLGADGAVMLDEVRMHAKLLFLGVVGVRDEPAIEHVGRAGDLGQQAANQSAATTLGHGQLQRRPAEHVQQLLRPRVKLR